MFLKVNYPDARIVIHFVPTNGMTIAELFPIVTEEVSKHLGEEIKIVELLTDDGFYLKPSLEVAHVLKPGDVIRAPTFASWKSSNSDWCSEDWHSLAREDLRDRIEKCATVGRHKRNKIFLKFWLGNSVEGLEILEASLFDGKTEATQTVIRSLTDEQEGKWSIQAKYWVNSNQIIQGISLHVKSSSDKFEWVDAIGITLNNKGQLVKGKVTTLKGAQDLEDADDDVEYKFDEPIIKGEDIPKQEVIPVVRHEAEGNSNLKLTWAKEGRISISQDDGDYYSKKFNVIASINHLQLLNNSDKPAAVTEIKTEFQNLEGKWVEATNTQIGVQTQGYYGPEYAWSDRLGTLKAMHHEKYGVKMFIPCVGDAAPTNALKSRIPKYLPQPLSLRITFTDADGGTVSHVFEHANPPIQFQTKQGFCAQNYVDPTLCHFIHCDDRDQTTRNWVALFVKSNRLTIHYSSGNYWDWDKKGLESIVFNAKEKSQNVYALDNLSQSGFKTWALLDFEHEKVYGFKFELSTKTNQATYFLPAPKFVRPHKGLEVNSVHCPDAYENCQLSASFHVENPTSSDQVAIFALDKDGVDGHIQNAYNSAAQKYGVVFLNISKDNYKEGTKYLCKYISKDKQIVCQSEFLYVGARRL